MWQVDQLCPCGLGQDYAACCGLYIGRAAAAPTAEALMRSRYSAYVRSDAKYLLRTWHVSTRPQNLELGAERAVKWLGLEILMTEAGGGGDAQGAVEFVARYKVNGKSCRLHERSRFIKEDGQWFYVDGDVR